MRYYILEDGQPKRVHNVLEWAMWNESEEGKEASRIGQDTLPDGTFVSTVFLGVDHSFSLSGKKTAPILFETMVFTEARSNQNLAKFDLMQLRYATREEACKGHAEVLTTLQTHLELN